MARLNYILECMTGSETLRSSRVVSGRHPPQGPIPDSHVLHVPGCVIQEHAAEKKPSELLECKSTGSRVLNSTCGTSDDPLKDVGPTRRGGAPERAN